MIYRQIPFMPPNNSRLAARDDDMVRAREGMDWMRQWKVIHPQFNTVEEGGY
jgi:hypothetical protein